MSFWTRGDHWSVSTFPDLSGKGNNFTQATGANQPTLTASDSNFNGQPTATFNGTSTFLSASTFTKGAGNDFFIWAVVRCTSKANFNTIWSENVATQAEFRNNQTSGDPSLFYAGTVANWGTDITNTTKAIYGFSLGAGGASGLGVSVSNGAAQVQTITSHTTTDPTPIGLGARTNSTLFFTGQMAEIVVCNTMPTNAQLTALQAYGVARYGSV